MTVLKNSNHFKFLKAVTEGNGTKAVRLIPHVEIDARVGNFPLLKSFAVPTILKSLADAPLLFYAIFLRREKVVRALVHSGAELNLFVEQGELGEFNAAGIAIAFSSPTMLDLVHKLGGGLSATCRPSSFFWLPI